MQRRHDGTCSDSSVHRSKVNLQEAGTCTREASWKNSWVCWENSRGQSERGEWFVTDLKDDSNQRDFLLSSFYSDIKGWIRMFTWTISSWLLLFQQNDVSFTAHWSQIKMPPLLRPVCELWIQIPSYGSLMCETCCLSHFMLHNYFISLSNKDTFQLLNIQSALQPSRTIDYIWLVL